MSGFCRRLQENFTPLGIGRSKREAPTYEGWSYGRGQLWWGCHGMQGHLPHCISRPQRPLWSKGMLQLPYTFVMCIAFYIYSLSRSAHSWYFSLFYFVLSRIRILVQKLTETPFSLGYIHMTCGRLVQEHKKLIKPLNMLKLIFEFLRYWKHWW